MKELGEDVSLLESGGIGGLDVVYEFVSEESNEEGVGIPVDLGVGESSVVESIFQGERAEKEQGRSTLGFEFARTRYSSSKLTAART